jgi:hypothetical protein
MKRLFLVATFFVLLSAPAFARKDEGDFPLTIHITAVSVEQGQTGISGGGSTDSNGNYSASVSGGESYTWKLFTAQIEGDKKTYGLSTDRMHYKGGRGLAIATLGWSKVATAKRNYWLGIGDYHGRWNKDGTLEIQFTDAKGNLAHQTFNIESEAATPTPPAPTEQAVRTPIASLHSENKDALSPSPAEQPAAKDEQLTRQTKVAYMVRRDGRFWIEDDKSLRNDTAADVVFADTTCRVIPSTMARWDYFTLCFSPQWKDPRFSGMCQKDANGDGCLIGWQKSSTPNTDIPVHPSLTVAKDKYNENYEVKNIKDNVITIQYQGRTLVGKCGFTLMHESPKEIPFRGCLTEADGKYGTSSWKACEQVDSTDCASLTDDSGVFVFSVHIHRADISGWAEVIWTNDSAILQDATHIPK